MNVHRNNTDLKVNAFDSDGLERCETLNTEYQMNKIEYLNFDKIDPTTFLPILNKQTIRNHLIDHELFDVSTVTKWAREKIKVDSTEGCRVRGIKVNNKLVGWCGIQFEAGKYEVAIVIDDGVWGIGKSVFSELMAWAKDLGHTTIFIHFLHTRPEYKFLSELATKVYENELLGSKFMTYELEVLKNTE